MHCGRSDRQLTPNPASTSPPRSSSPQLDAFEPMAVITYIKAGEHSKDSPEITHMNGTAAPYGRIKEQLTE